MIERDHITGLVLAGGRGLRMGGVDKGLQRHHGVPLAMRALLRLSPQVGRVVISANRNLQTYAAMGVAVWPDALPGFAGPLAGFLSGLERCSTPFMLAVPCDAPMFPADLAQRLAQALEAEHAEIAKAVTHDGEALRAQPVFCLMKTILRASLARFVESGQRKVDAWTALHHTVEVPFPEARAFTNVNTPDELAQLQLKSCGGYESRSMTRR